DEFPSIKTLSDHFECSRGTIQLCIQQLEMENAVSLDKSKSGTVVTFVDLNILQRLFFNSEIKVSLPLSLLNNEDNYYILTQLHSDFNHLESSLFTSFEQSSLRKLELLVNGNIHMAIVTDAYWSLINKSDLSILNSYDIKSPSTLTYSFSIDGDSTSMVEEQATDYQTLNSGSVKPQMKLLKPEKYYIITRTELKTLLSNNT
ncbi:MAG: helix-turn-helix domain-containing protein, partial [Coprobacillaceae bacterium]